MSVSMFVKKLTVATMAIDNVLSLFYRYDADARTTPLNHHTAMMKGTSISCWEKHLRNNLKHH